MDYKKIDELLDKYWECQTSLDEEAILKEYFNSNNVNEKHSSVASLFQYYVDEKKQTTLDAGFDEKVLTSLNSIGGFNVKKEPVRQTKIIKFFGDVLKVAAVGLILITAGYFIKEEVEKEDAQPLLTDTFEDPQKAFEETKKALQLISNNFNKGRKQAKKVATFSEAQEQVKENI